VWEQYAQRVWQEVWPEGFTTHRLMMPWQGVATTGASVVAAARERMRPLMMQADTDDGEDWTRVICIKL
jgi:hypothetical protein